MNATNLIALVGTRCGNSAFSNLNGAVVTELTTEMEILRYQNKQLGRDNENLMAQISSSHHHLRSAPLNITCDGQKLSMKRDGSEGWDRAEGECEIDGYRLN